MVKTTFALQIFILSLRNFEQYIVTYHIKHDHDLLWQA